MTTNIPKLIGAGLVVLIGMYFIQSVWPQAAYPLALLIILGAAITHGEFADELGKLTKGS